MRAFISRTATVRAVEHGAGDDGVADVEFHDLADGGDGLYVVIVEAVAGVDHESETGGEFGTGVEALELGGLAGAS